MAALNARPRLSAGDQPTGLSQVVEAGLVDGEVADGRSVLGTHVGDGGAVGDRQLGHARTEELDKLPDDADLTQVLHRDGRSA